MKDLDWLSRWYSKKKISSPILLKLYRILLGLYAGGMFLLLICLQLLFWAPDRVVKKMGRQGFIVRPFGDKYEKVTLRGVFKKDQHSQHRRGFFKL
jgi:hypothetical protein